MSYKKNDAKQAHKEAIIKIFNTDSQSYTNVIIPSKLTVGLDS